LENENGSRVEHTAQNLAQIKMLPPDFSKLSQYEMQRLEGAANYKQVEDNNVDDECHGNFGGNYSQVLPGLRDRLELPQATKRRSTLC
jgi:hypothetical protein